MPVTTDDLNDRARLQFFALGLDYYIAGRFATFAGLFPIAGNLLHHAIEMFLKGALVRIVGLGPRRDAGHDLNELWGMFKPHMPCAEAASFDQPIAEMHRFERLRYPDTAIREGMEATLAISGVIVSKRLARVIDCPDPHLYWKISMHSRS